MTDAAFVLHVALGVLLVWAGLLKAWRPRVTRAAVYGYRIVPLRLLTPAAVAVTAAELTAGAALLVGVWTRYAAVAAGLLFTVFAASILTALARGIRTPCSCFGASQEETTSVATLVRAVLLAAGAGILVVIGTTHAVPVMPAGIVPGVVAGLCVAVLLRLIGLAPQIWTYLTEQPVIAPARGHRVSLRALPLDDALTLPLESRPADPSTGFSQDSR